MAVADGRSDPKPMIDPAALSVAAEAGARDRAQREASARPPKHPPKPERVDPYGRPRGLSRIVFSWASYGFLFTAFLIVVGVSLLGQHPGVSAFLFVWAALNLFGLITVGWRRTKAGLPGSE